MKYKKSRYNYIVGKGNDNEKIMFNTFTSAMVTINPHLEKIISVSEIYLNELESEDLEYIESLVELGFLVECSYDEIIGLEMLGEREKYRNDNELHITIAPTMDCNMECPYCFQSDDIKTTIMSYKICDNIIQFIDERLKNRPYLHITWFGGEPLMAMKQIAYLSERLIEICNQNEVTYNSSIVTNGYNLTAENAKVLKEKYKVSFAQVTIDGLEEQHNRKRILKKGVDSFSKIISNIKLAVEHLEIVIRVNVDNDNKGSLNDLIDYLLIKESLLGKVSVGISPVFDFEDKKNCNYNNYCSKEAWNIESLEVLKHYLTIDHVENFHSATLQPSLVSCSANVYDSYIFDSDGDIYKCFLSLGKKPFSIGNVIEINRKSYLLNNEKHKRWISTSHARECNSCVFLPLCQSGCLYERFEQNKSHICLKSKDNIKEILMETYNYYESIKIGE